MQAVVRVGMGPAELGAIHGEFGRLGHRDQQGRRWAPARRAADDADTGSAGQLAARTGPTTGSGPAGAPGRRRRVLAAIRICLLATIKMDRSLSPSVNESGTVRRESAADYGCATTAVTVCAGECRSANFERLGAACGRVATTSWRLANGTVPHWHHRSGVEPGPALLGGETADHRSRSIPEAGGSRVWQSPRHLL